MITSTPVNGLRTDFNGVIVAINKEQSGFIYDGDFEDSEPDGVTFTLSLEVADIGTDKISYFPSRRNELFSSAELKDYVPIVKESSDITTQTVVIQENCLNSIRTKEKIINDAYESFDTKFPVQMLWEDIRGNEITVEGVNFHDLIVCNTVSINRKDNVPSFESTEVSDKIETELTQMYRKRLNDGDLDVNISVSVKDSILNLSYRVSNHRTGQDYTGEVKLTDKGFEIID